jgi:hypothetical protein
MAYSRCRFGGILPILLHVVGACRTTTECWSKPAYQLFLNQR